MNEDFKVGDSIVHRGGSDGILRVVTAVGVDKILYTSGKAEWAISKESVRVVKPFFEVGKTYEHWGVNYTIENVRDVDGVMFAWAIRKTGIKSFMTTIEQGDFPNFILVD